MKNLFVVLLVAAIATGCSMQNAQNEKNIALIENYIQAVENMDYDAMALYLDENYLGLGPSYGDSIWRDAAIENWKYNVENLYESIKYNRSRNVAINNDSGENQGNWVSNWGELTIRYKNSTDQVTIWANTIYKIENGKIIKSYTFYNEADALRQLGYSFYK